MIWRVLTVRQPWAWAIMMGFKPVENRTQNLAGTYRGPVLIHAGQAYADPVSAGRCLSLAGITESQGWAESPMGQTGVILGSVDLVDVHRSARYSHGLPVCFADPAPACNSLWAESGAVHHAIRDPRRLRHPIPEQGRLGLWSWHGPSQLVFEDEAA